MIFLVGIDHTLQHDNAEFSFPKKEAALPDFLAYLESTALKLKVTTIAEEFSEEALQINKVKYSTIQSVANKLELKHIFCDPTTEERQKNKITKKDTDKREEYWFECLRNVVNENILFICGEKHLESFSLKLQQKGILVEIVSREWGIIFDPP